jgi:hypothetical protein
MVEGGMGVGAGGVGINMGLQAMSRLPPNSSARGFSIIVRE